MQKVRDMGDANPPVAGDLFYLVRPGAAPFNYYLAWEDLLAVLPFLTQAQADLLYDAIGTAAAAVAAHVAAGDPHPQYLTPAEANALYDALGAATAAVVAHEGAADPHPQYLTPAEGDALFLTPAEGNAAYDAIGAAAAVAAASQDNIQFQDEGGNLGAPGTVDTLNFVGAGVVAGRAGNIVTVTVAGGGGGSADIVAVTVNVPTPTKNASVVVVDAAVAPTDRIMTSWGNCLHSDANHPSMGEVAFNAIAGAGQFVLEIFSMDESNLFGDFKLNYMRAA